MDGESCRTGNFLGEVKFQMMSRVSQVKEETNGPYKFSKPFFRNSSHQKVKLVLVIEANAGSRITIASIKIIS